MSDRIEQELRAIRKSQDEIKITQGNILELLSGISDSQENFRESLSQVINIQGEIIKVLNQHSENFDKVITFLENMSK